MPIKSDALILQAEMTEVPNDDSVVKVHLSINHENETLSVDFPFSKKFDDIDSVVADLIETLSISDIDPNAIKSMIEAQVYKAAPPRSGPSFEPINDNQVGNNSILSLEDSDSDDYGINDSEYVSLLQQQKKEMQALNIRQYNEKKALAQRIAASTLASNQFNQAASIADKKGGNCDDLIVF
ncbi:hypothetical protein GPJ56_009893 [Histomonas meleagridis]|uniref:uncharacterized protein n=1 Tax=Histomonas meleagridis TaxID=135588 RepID=UPI003559F3CD|nr:hypothetical protein GPJ56_009893 [Histomonas meleagridis]KAH0802800.1 hypothetical protein GO595_004307 [Histomonas meleagridis]